MIVESWGRLPGYEHHAINLHSPALVPDSMRNYRPGIAFGMGRSYGDVCLNPGGNLWLTKTLDKFVKFDGATGLLTCEAGVLLRDIQDTFALRGWMLPVTPGTQFVTVGGAIANDVHGKNHHRVGSFGDHVKSIRLARSDGSQIECSPDLNPDWFSATTGGIGLTGVITEATLQLRPVKGSWIDTETIAFQNLDEFFSLADSSEKKWEYTVSWIDCITRGGGRGIFMRGNHSSLNTLPPAKGAAHNIPFTPPLSLVNRWSLLAFNETYFRRHQLSSGATTQHYKSFFYPLDNLLNWNRMYGPKGFFQYQSVVPRQGGDAALAAMLREISKSKQGSFLAVLKTFGDRLAPGLLSFPQPGITLALDFPNRGNATENLFKRLDAIVTEANGRIYLAKDARMPRALFKAGYPRLDEFLKYRDPGISSAMSRRLLGN